MNKIRIIDLLNKIANGEEVPKKIRFCRRLFIWVDNDYICCEVNSELGDCNGLSIHKWIYSSLLNDEVEIIEEDNKIEKLEIEKDENTQNYFIRNEYGTKCYLTKHSKVIASKINELIDEVNKLKVNK